MVLSAATGGTMGPLSEFRVDFTLDDITGRATAYMLGADFHAEWHWLADTEFGPFDTASDVGRWVAKVLAAQSILRLR